MLNGRRPLSYRRGAARVLLSLDSGGWLSEPLGFLSDGERAEYVGLLIEVDGENWSCLLYVDDPVAPGDSAGATIVMLLPSPMLFEGEEFNVLIGAKPVGRVKILEQGGQGSLISEPPSASEMLS